MLRFADPPRILGDGLIMVNPYICAGRAPSTRRSLIPTAKWKRGVSSGINAESKNQSSIAILIGAMFLQYLPSARLGFVSLPRTFFGPRAFDHVELPALSCWTKIQYTGLNLLAINLCNSIGKAYAYWCACADS
jgi:hypothetical protein